MIKNKKLAINFLVGIIISIIFIYISFNKLKLHDIYQSILSIDLKYVVLSTVFITITIAIRGLRFRYLLYGKKKCSTYHLISSTYIGFFINNILPARIGEIARAYLIGKNSHISKTSILTTIFFERLIDLVTMIVLFLIISIMFPNLSTQLNNKISTLKTIDIKFYMLLLFLSLTLFIVLVFRLIKGNNKFLIKMINKVLIIFPDIIKNNIKTILKKISHGVYFPNNLNDKFYFIFYTIIYWGLLVFGIMIMFFSFKFGNKIINPYLVAFNLLIIISIANVIPFTPASIGILQFVIIICLTFFGVKETEAGAFSLVYHISIWTSTTIVGFIFFLLSGLNLKQYKNIENIK